MNDADYLAEDATGLAALISSGAVNAAEVMDAALNRVAQVNPKINALVHEDFDRARQTAQTPPQGTFGGVPFVVKDLDPVAGMPMYSGSRAMPGRVMEADGRVATQLKSMGFIPIGKSQTPEYGLTAATETARFGPARNPWNLDHSTGGSSGGSAALVASGALPIAHANDGGGSIRIPAACCGLIGLKPSNGRMAPTETMDIMPVKIAVQGAVARTMRDAIAFHLAAEQHRAPDAGLQPLADVEWRPLKPKRIAVIVDNPLGNRASPDNLKAVDEAAKALEALGHHIIPIEGNPVPAKFADYFLIYWGLIPAMLQLAGKRAVDPDFDKSQLEEWSKGLANFFWRNIWRAPYAVWQLKRYHKAYEAMFTDFDLILSPVLARPPVPIGELDPMQPPKAHMEKLLDYATFTPFQNASGAPAIALPIGRTAGGLPLGVQIAAPFGADGDLLQLGSDLEAAGAWPKWQAAAL